MATCPQCGRRFDDEMRFCLDDGMTLKPDIHYPTDPGLTNAKTEELSGASGLIDHATAETIVGARSLRTNSGHSGNSSGLFGIVVAGVIIVGGFLVITAAGIAGYLYYDRAVQETAKETSEPERPSVNAPLVIDNRDVTAEDQVVDDKPPIDEPANKIIKSPTPEPASTATPTPRPPANKAIDEPKTPEPENTRPKIPKQISGGVLNGKAVSLPKPRYPPAARAVRASGPVTVQVLVDENGNVVSASAISGHPLLRAAAARAARGAKFTPTLIAGRPVKVSGVVTYNFVPPAS